MRSRTVSWFGFLFRQQPKAPGLSYETAHCVAGGVCGLLFLCLSRIHISRCQSCFYASMVENQFEEVEYMVSYWDLQLQVFIKPEADLYQEYQVNCSFFSLNLDICLSLIWHYLSPHMCSSAKLYRTLSYHIFVFMCWNRMRVFPLLALTAAWQSLQGKVFFFSRKPYPQNGGCPLLCREWRDLNLRLRCCGLTFTSFSLLVSSVYRCITVLLLGNRVVAGERLCCVPVGCDLLTAGSGQSQCWQLSHTAAGVCINAFSASCLKVAAVWQSFQRKRVSMCTFCWQRVSMFFKVVYFISLLTGGDWFHHNKNHCHEHQRWYLLVDLQTLWFSSLSCCCK